MKNKNLIFWAVSFFLMFIIFIYQRKTGPTYPVEGKIKINKETVKYKLPRSWTSGKNCKISIKIKSENIKVFLKWRRFKFDKEWKENEMSKEGENLVGFLPSQPPAGKLEYFIVIEDENGKIFHIPEKSAVIRFKGSVPIYILFPHIIFMFFAMLFNIRTSIEALINGDKIKKYSFYTLITLIPGGFILGPIVQKFAFGALWTGIPFGWDLTDNKTLIAGLFWIVAYYFIKKGKNKRFWAILASSVMILVYLIPHSVMGSTFDYSKGKVIVGKN